MASVYVMLLHLFFLLYVLPFVPLGFSVLLSIASGLYARSFSRYYVFHCVCQVLRIPQQFVHSHSSGPHLLSESVPLSYMLATLQQVMFHCFHTLAALTVW